MLENVCNVLSKESHRTLSISVLVLKLAVLVLLGSFAVVAAVVLSCGCMPVTKEIYVRVKIIVLLVKYLKVCGDQDNSEITLRQNLIIL